MRVFTHTVVQRSCVIKVGWSNKMLASCPLTRHSKRYSSLWSMTHGLMTHLKMAMASAPDRPNLPNKCYCAVFIDLISLFHSDYLTNNFYKMDNRSTLHFKLHEIQLLCLMLFSFEFPNKYFCQPAVFGLELHLIPLEWMFTDKLKGVTERDARAAQLFICSDYWHYRDA